MEVIAKAGLLQISSIVFGELLAGFAWGGREAAHRQELRRFLALRSVQILPTGLTTADQNALLYRSHRQQGRPIATNDLWIAAGCLEHAALIFSLDAHFEAVPGLLLIRSWAHMEAGPETPLDLPGGWLRVG